MSVGMGICLVKSISLLEQGDIRLVLFHVHSDTVKYKSASAFSDPTKWGHLGQGLKLDKLKTGWSAMKFGKRYSKVTVFMAMLHGVLIGVAAVAVIGLLLVATKGKDNANTSVKELPASGPAPVENSAQPDELPLQLFAKQHGVFSSAESAALFIAEDPSLAKAAVIQSNDKYFVWTAVGLMEGEIDSSESEGTYRKTFMADTSACGAIGAGKLRDALTQTEIAKINYLDEGQKAGNEDEKTKEFNKNITTITAFTKDLRIIRLRLLSHYSHTENCVKIKF